MGEYTIEKLDNEINQYVKRKETSPLHENFRVK